MSTVVVYHVYHDEIAGLRTAILQVLLIFYNSYITTTTNRKIINILKTELQDSPSGFHQLANYPYEFNFYFFPTLIKNL